MSPSYFREKFGKVNKEAKISKGFSSDMSVGIRVQKTS